MTKKKKIIKNKKKKKYMIINLKTNTKTNKSIYKLITNKGR